MKRLMAAGLALGLIASLATAGCAKKSQEVKPKAAGYTNPVYVGGKDGLPEAADPMAIKYNGEYYAYVTGDPCQVLKSDDLVRWQLLGKMTTEVVNCWAPDVVYKNGVFYAYLSTELPTDPEHRRVRLYTSPKPEGPFAFVADVTGQYSYDAHYFADDDGKEYLYWTQNCVISNDSPCSGGNGVIVDRLVDMQRLAGQVTRVADPEGWECVGRCILEAPSVVKHDGKYYMLYSGAAYENGSYANGVVRGPAPMGPGRAKDESWTKLDRVLQTIELKVDGPGGASWVKGPNNLDDWTIYHGRVFTRDTMERWLRIDPVMWGVDRFWVPGGASFAEQPGPALPAFRDLFTQDISTGLGKGWNVTGGVWSVGGGAAKQADAAAGGARAVVGSEAMAASEYVFEANVRWVPGGAGSGQAGVYAYYLDDKNFATVVLDRGVRELLVTSVVGGTLGEVRHVSLPGDFNFSVFHQVLVTKNGARLVIRLDGRQVDGFSVPFTQPGRAGLVTAGAAAEFDGVSLTHGWEDSAADGAQPFKGSHRWGSYAFTASVKVGGARAGVYAAYADEKHYVQVLLDGKAGALQSVAVVNGKQETVSTPLKEFDPNQYHAVRVVKNGFNFSVYVDGALLQQRSVALERGQPGLIAEGGGVEFRAIRAVRWD